MILNNFFVLMYCIFDFCNKKDIVFCFMIKGISLLIMRLIWVVLCILMRLVFVIKGD